MPVFEATLDSGEKNRRKKKEGILKQTVYQFHKNFKPELMRVLSKEQFCARKAALVNHSLICETPTCIICRYFKTVSNYKFDAGNFSRYVSQGYPQQVAKSPKPSKTVKFEEDTVFAEEATFDSLYLNYRLVANACMFNISFREAMILQRE